MGVAVNINNIYTYKDYLEIKDISMEVIEGIPFLMSPSPTVEHQRILRKILIILSSHLENSDCEVFSAPLDVVLINENEEVLDSKNIVQPDVFIVCDRNKIGDKNIIGAPDLIVEIVSTGSQSLDYVKKLNLYEKYKVKEYIIVNPINKTILQYVFEDNSFSAPKIYNENGVVEINLFKDFIVDFKNIF